MNKTWEEICTRCGKCCLVKIQNDETEEVFYTKVVCKYYDIPNKKCSVYENRCILVPECLKLTPENVSKIEFMPKACAYRSLFDKDYKPVEGDISGFCISEELVNEEDLEDYIIEDQ